jgi:hypothetical protein
MAWDGVVALEKRGELGSYPNETLLELQEAGFLSAKNREMLQAVVDRELTAVRHGRRHRHEVGDIAMNIIGNLREAIALWAVVGEPKKSTPRREPKKSRRSK